MLQTSEVERFRHDSFWSKEPETLEWIKDFADGDTFFDIGANVGVYSLYCAAVHRWCKVFAFEPDAKNFARLQENIEANAYANIVAAQYAVSDRPGVGVFAEASPIIGSSGGQYDQGLCNGQAHYHVSAVTVDILADLYGPPQHVKIDIDGQEARVVRGMRNILKDPRLKSVLVEFALAGEFWSNAAMDRVDGIDAFLRSGFTNENRYNAIPNHSRIRRAAEGIHVENIVFTRTT
jgi:FkbM family methyltransferase